MINIRDVQDERIVRWAQNRLREDLGLNVYFDPATSTTLTIDNDEELFAVVVFTNYQPPATIEMSIYSQDRRWCSRKVLKECFRYCFETLGVRRIYTQVKSDNKKALDMNKRLGFEEIAVLPEQIVDMAGNVLDNHIFTMTRENCKWLEVF